MTPRVLEKFKRMNVIDMYVNQGLSLNQMQTIVSSDKRTIRDYLLANGVEVKGVKNPGIILDKSKFGQQKCEQRFAYQKFDVINTEEKAYWLGFWFADGCVNSNMKDLELRLQACDVGHLHKFNRFMECQDNNVHYHCKIAEEKIYDSYGWSMTSNHTCEVLTSYGCTPRKSLTLKFPDKSIFKSEDLIRHFIRGYWDGDGCLCFTYNTHHVSVLGTEDFLNELKKYLPGFENINPSRHNSSTFQIGCSDKKAYDVVSYLYKDASIYLDRKYEKYLDFCRAYEESYV